jgi:hypothetical protein
MSHEELEIAHAVRMLIFGALAHQSGHGPTTITVDDRPFTFEHDGLCADSAVLLLGANVARELSALKIDHSILLSGVHEAAAEIERLKKGG